MKVFKVVSAIDFVYDCIRDDECELCWDDVSDLVKTVLDKGLDTAFDYIVCNEFPNGVDSNEFVEFVKNKQSFIFKELGFDEDKNN